MQVKINLNDKIKVKLTEYGQQIYYQKLEDLNKTAGRKIVKPSFREKDADGYSEFQMHDFMNIYGEYMHCCAPNVIDPIKIICENELYRKGDPYVGDDLCEREIHQSPRDM